MKESARRKLCALLAAAVLCGLMAACGQQSQQSQGGTAAQSAGNGEIHTVTLNPNGGTWPDGSAEAVTVEVEDGSAIDFASYTPEYEGNTLYGWYQPDSLPWPGARKVTADLSLKAKWSVTETVETYPLNLVINGESELLEYENGVYQFTHVSLIHGGYAQRSAKYTVYEDELLAAAQADDGSAPRVLYHAESSYVDATGTLYAEFYNDGQFELFYDYTYGGERTKYCMDIGSWTYEGYTAPVAPAEISEEIMGTGQSLHEGWDASLLGEDAAQEQPAEEPAPDIDTLPGEVILTVDATVSETMKARFRENGVLTIYMTTYDVDTDSKFLWSVGEEGLVITYNGGEENRAADNGDGTWLFSDAVGNDYTVSLEALTAASPEAAELYTAAATVSETMFARFYDNHSLSILFDLTAYGQAGAFATVAQGQWAYSQEDGLQIVAENAALALEDPGDGTLAFTVGDNTYSVNLAEFTAAMG